MEGKYRNGALSFAPVAAFHGVRVHDGGDGTGRLDTFVCPLGPSHSGFQPLWLNSDELRNEAVLKQQFQCKKPI